MKAEETWAEQATYMYDFHIQELQETGSMWEKLLKKYLGNIPGKKVLDTGCGTGFLSVILAKNGWKVTAIDNSSDMLEQAKVTAEQYGLSEYITFLKRDAEHTELASDTFDAVVSRHASWLFSEPVTAYKEWFRLLKSGGTLMNLDANWCIPLGTSEAAEQFVEDEKELIKRYGEFQDHYHDKEMMVALRQLPLAFQERPEWDKKVCEDLGFHSIEYDFLLEEGYIFKTKSGFNYPLQKKRSGGYKIQSGELIRVCMTSDFFLEEADAWRNEAWEIMRQRPDVKFFLLTKRPQRVKDCLPDDWGDGWENVMLNVSCENQRRADERIPLLLSLPFKHKGIMCAPFIGPVSLVQYLGSGQIEQVICGGENYDGASPCDFDWVKNLRAECVTHDITFCFIETGTNFIKDGRLYHLPKKQVQSEMAFKSGISYEGKPIQWKLTDRFGMDIPKDALYVPHYRYNCKSCGSRLICNGCSDCGRCEI